MKWVTRSMVGWGLEDGKLPWTKNKGGRVAQRCGWWGLREGRMVECESYLEWL